MHLVRNSGHQEAQTASHRGLGEEGHLFGNTAGLKKVDHANSRLEASAQSIHTRIRRPTGRLHLKWQLHRIIYWLATGFSDTP